MIVDSMINEASLVRPESFNVKSLNLQLINSLPPSGYWARKPVSNWLSFDRQRASSLSVLSYSPVSLYKQRESWNTVFNARKATCNLPLAANSTCNLQLAEGENRSVVFFHKVRTGIPHFPRLSVRVCCWGKVDCCFLLFSVYSLKNIQVWLLFSVCMKVNKVGRSSWIDGKGGTMNLWNNW